MYVVTNKLPIDTARCVCRCQELQAGGGEARRQQDEVTPSDVMRRNNLVLITERGPRPSTQDERARIYRTRYSIVASATTRAADQSRQLHQASSEFGIRNSEFAFRVSGWSIRFGLGPLGVSKDAFVSRRKIAFRRGEVWGRWRCARGIERPPWGKQRRRHRGERAGAGGVLQPRQCLGGAHLRRVGEARGVCG